jgi:hypothetical protein
MNLRTLFLKGDNNCFGATGMSSLRLDFQFTCSPKCKALTQMTTGRFLGPLTGGYEDICCLEYNEA